jgi:hypothetical protein
MSNVKQVIVLCFSLLFIANVHAGSQSDSKVLGEKCRQLALKLDSLSRYQDRALCTTNLDGGKVYTASQYILSSRGASAKTLLDAAIIQIKFAIDIRCYGQNDMKDILKDLEDIYEDL